MLYLNYIFNALCFYIFLIQPYKSQVVYEADSPLVYTIYNNVNTKSIQFQFAKIDGRLFMYLQIKNAAAFYKIIGEECWPEKGRIGWHIHDGTEFSTDLGVGQDSCNANKTKGHWDPTLACGPSSGNSLCKKLQIPPSSVIPDNLSTGEYQCNPPLYHGNYSYACEIGDLSGKYGELIIPPIWNNTLTIALFTDDIHDTIRTRELINKSIVLHCSHSTARALCLKLELVMLPLDLFYDLMEKRRYELAAYANYVKSSLEESV